MTKCATCGVEFGGLNTCHCTAKGCHETFSGIQSFDQHRKYRKCQRPQTVGLVQIGRAYPCWGIAGEKPDVWKD